MINLVSANILKLIGSVGRQNFFQIYIYIILVRSENENICKTIRARPKKVQGRQEK